MPIAAVRKPTFDPSQAIAQLAAGRQAARVIRKTRTSGRSTSGRVSSYPAALNEESLYASAASPEEKALKETENRSNWNSDRQQQLQHQRNTRLPAEAAGILKSAPDVAEDPEVKGYVDNYRNGLGRLEDSASKRGGVDPVRRLVDRQKNKLKKDLVSNIKKSKIFQEGKKKATRWIWRGIGPIGSAVSVPSSVPTFGVTLIEFLFGLFVNGFQTLKTVVLPIVTEDRPGDPDSGQIFKGILSFAEPTSLDPKDPATWMVDAPYSAIWFFLINYIHLFVLAFLTIIGAVVLVVSGTGSLLGEYRTAIASMLGIT